MRKYNHRCFKCGRFMKIGFKNTVEHEEKYQCHTAKYNKLTIGYLEQILKNL